MEITERRVSFRDFRYSFRAFRVLFYRLQLRQPLIRIAETIQPDAHDVHDREKQAASAPIVIALFKVIQNTPGP